MDSDRTYLISVLIILVCLVVELCFYYRARKERKSLSSFKMFSFMVTSSPRVVKSPNQTDACYLTVPHVQVEPELAWMLCRGFVRLAHEPEDIGLPLARRRHVEPEEHLRTLNTK